MQELVTSEVEDERGRGWIVTVRDAETKETTVEINLFPYDFMQSSHGACDVVIYEHLLDAFRMSYATYGSREHRDAYFNLADRNVRESWHPLSTHEKGGE